MKARQIEWITIDFDGKKFNGKVLELGDYFIWEVRREWVVNSVFGEPIVLHDVTPDQAKQACQRHLQQYVDSLYNDLQQLTEDL